MTRTITLMGLAAILIVPHAVLAGPPSGYGTEGPHGQRLDAAAQSSFQRDWNAARESENRARRSADWIREHGMSFPTPF